MIRERCRGLHVSGRGTKVTAKNCVMSKCGWSNIGVYDSATLVLEDCTCNSSMCVSFVWVWMSVWVCGWVGEHVEHMVNSAGFLSEANGTDPA
eukprot:scaffold240367_cov27-Tisochrysis_lutea.AAC.1